MTVKLSVYWLQLTEERRKELVKLVKKYGEECKVAMRNIRRHAIQDLKDGQKEGLITEDDLKQGEKEIQKVTDEEIKNIDAILKEKRSGNFRGLMVLSGYDLFNCSFNYIVFH